MAKETAAQRDARVEEQARDLQEADRPEVGPLQDGDRDMVPVMPWEININMASIGYEPVEGGGMILSFSPCVSRPDGLALTPPQIRIPFGAEQWEVFKAEVARDGVKSRIVRATALPR